MLAINLQQIHFEYRSKRQEDVFSLALEHFTVEVGEKMVLFGPSGCGKSTLLNLIAGELIPTTGKVEVLSCLLNAQSDSERRAFRIQNIGFVFQDFPLVSHLSALENVVLPYRINPALVLDDSVWDRGRQLIVDLGLSGKENRLPHKLSQGERQRVAIARALITKPKIMLADEPTAGLDPVRSVAVMELVERVVQERGMTLVVVTHDPNIRRRFTLSLDMGEMQ